MPPAKTTIKKASKSPTKTRGKAKAPLPSPPKTRFGGRPKSNQITPPRKGAPTGKATKPMLKSLPVSKLLRGKGQKTPPRSKRGTSVSPTRTKSPAGKHPLETNSSMDTVEEKHKKEHKKRLTIRESEDSEDQDDFELMENEGAEEGAYEAKKVTQEGEEEMDSEDDQDSLEEELDLLSKRTKNREYLTRHEKAMKGESWSDEEEGEDADAIRLKELQEKRHAKAAKLAAEQEDGKIIELSSGPSSSCASSSSEEEEESEDTEEYDEEEVEEESEEEIEEEAEEIEKQHDEPTSNQKKSNKNTQKNDNNDEHRDEDKSNKKDNRKENDNQSAGGKHAANDEDERDGDNGNNPGKETNGKNGLSDDNNEGEENHRDRTTSSTQSPSARTKLSKTSGANPKTPPPSPPKTRRLAPNGGKTARRSPRLRRDKNASTEPATMSKSDKSPKTTSKTSDPKETPKQSYAKAAKRPPLQSALKKSSTRFSEQPVDSSGVEGRIALQARRIRTTVCTEHPDCQPEMMRMILVQLAGIFGHIRTCMKSANLQRKKKKYLWIRKFNDTTKPDYYNRKDKGWIDVISSKMNFSDFCKYFQGAFYMNTRPRSGKWYFRFTIVLPEEEDIADLVKNVTFNLPNSHERLQDLTTSQEIFNPFKVSFLHRSNRQLAYDTDFLDRVNEQLTGGVKVGFSWACISKTAPGEMWNAKKAIYAIVVECNEHQVEPATHQLKKLFPLVREKGFVPILGCHLSFGYLDTHPHIKNNHVAVRAISKLINRQKVHTDNEVLLSTTAILPGSLYLEIPGTDHTLQSLLMATRSTITEEGAGGQIFHTCTYNHQNGAHTCNFTTHKIYEVEASSIVSAIGVFLRDELGLTGLEDYIAVHSINEDDKWHIGTRCVDNEASRWLDQQIELTEDLDAPAVEAQESPAINAAFTPQEIREFQRQAGLRDEETVVNWTQARRSAQPMTPQQSASLHQALQQLPPPQMVTQTSDEASVASTIGNQSTTGFSLARSTASGKSMASKAGREMVMQQCQDMIEEQQQKTEALMNEKFTQMMSMLSALSQVQQPSQSASGGPPGGDNV